MHKIMHFEELSIFKEYNKMASLKYRNGTGSAGIQIKC